MRVYVSLVVLMLALAGCSGKKKDAGDDPVVPGDDDAIAAVLKLSIAIGNKTFNVTSDGGLGGHTGHGASSSSSGTTTGNATSTAGNATGNLTGNATGNLTAPSGTAPLRVNFTVSATGIANATGLRWTLDFGERGNATAANATASAGNATAGNATGQASGTVLPGTANHTYAAAGDFNVTYVLQAGNTTLGSVKATLHVDAANGTATVTKALPAVTHFEYGESWGCDGSTGEPACVDFLAGPPGSDIDGHWIELGEPYWGLALTSTVDQGGLLLADSDCVFTDADVAIIGDANNGSDPCTGTVPEGAAWLFIYPYGVGAFGMTVDFGVPAA